MISISGPFHTNRFSLVVHSGVCLRPGHRRLFQYSGVLSPAHPHGCRGRLRLWPPLWGCSVRTHALHPHPAAAAGTGDRGSGAGGRGAAGPRPPVAELHCGPAPPRPLPPGRPASPGPPCPLRSLREGTRSSPGPHVSGRAGGIVSDRDTFHNSCSAVVTQPAVVMPQILTCKSCRIIAVVS